MAEREGFITVTVCEQYSASPISVSHADSVAFLQQLREVVLAEYPVDPAPVHANPVQRALAWLRAGYPDGIPSTDYVPILALLRRRLNDDEVREVADALISHDIEEDGVVSRVEAQVLMTKILGELPSDEDLHRVEARLAESGWNLV